MKGSLYSFFGKTKEAKEYKPIAFETTATLDLANDTVDTVTKEQKAEKVSSYSSKSFSISVDSNYTDEDIEDLGKEGKLDLEAYVKLERISAAELQKMAWEQQELYFRLTKNKINSYYYEGSAVIDSTSSVFPAEGESTFSLKLKGKGLKILKQTVAVLPVV